MIWLGGAVVMSKPRSRIAQGKSIQDILRMPVSKIQGYTPAQQREIVSRLASAANKRLRTLEKSGINNSATSRLNYSGGKISVRSKSGDELIQEMIRARDFLTNKFSSKKEWIKTIKNIKKNETFKNVSISNVSKAFAAYEMARETNPELINKIYKYTLMDFIDSLYSIEGLTDPEEVNRRVIEFAQSEYARRNEEFESETRRFSNAIEYDIPVRARNKRKR